MCMTNPNQRNTLRNLSLIVALGLGMTACSDAPMPPLRDKTLETPMPACVDIMFKVGPLDSKTGKSKVTITQDTRNETARDIWKVARYQFDFGDDDPDNNYYPKPSIAHDYKPGSYNVAAGFVIDVAPHVIAPIGDNTTYLCPTEILEVPALKR